MATVEALLTIEDYCRLPDDGRRTELVRGRIVELTRPNFVHGLLCTEIGSILRLWVKDRGLGRVIGNDSGIVIHRGPDTLRGADIAYYSYVRLPKDSVPARYPDVAPEIVFEVRSPNDRWRDVHAKIAEYLGIGVLVVCVVDPDPQSVHVFRPDERPQVLGPADELTFPECLPGFGVVVGSLFE